MKVKSASLVLAAMVASGIVSLTSCGSSTMTTPAAPPAPPFTVKVVGFNDYHGNLESPGTFGLSTAVAAADRPAVGGAEFLAAHVAKLKSANSENVVVGAGDLIGAKYRSLAQAPSDEF
jgi:5'-nucleotidase